MLKTFKNDEKKSTVAVIEDCGTDAIARIGKVMAARHQINLNRGDCKRCESVKFAYKLVPNAQVAEMSDTIKATVTCDARDTYDVAVGESEAVKKAMSNHKKAFIKALTRWQVAMLKDIMAVSPETFEDALKKVRKCSCCKDK